MEQGWAGEVVAEVRVSNMLMVHLENLIKDLGKRVIIQVQKNDIFAMPSRAIHVANDIVDN